MFKVLTVVSYLGGFIGGDKSKLDCLQDLILKLEKNIFTIIKTEGKYTQEYYSAVVRVIQSEWIFLQRVTKNTGCVFAGVENLLWETFFPHLFFGKSKSIPPIVGTLSMMPSNEPSLGLQNPVTSVDEYSEVFNVQSHILLGP